MKRYLVFVVLLLVACNDASRKTGNTGSTGSTATTQAAAIRYMALGDSFTIGTGNPPADSFPARLADRWRAKGERVELKNLGVNGYTTDDVNALEVPEVKPFRPTFVTLAIGANDRVAGRTPDYYRSNVRVILKAVIDAGVQPSHVVTLPQPDWSLSPAAASFGEPKQIGADIVQFNAILKDETEKIGAIYIDLFPLMHRQAEQRMLAPDGLHPNAHAHDEWAAMLFEKIPPTSLK